MKFKLFIFTLLALFITSCTLEPFPEPIEEDGQIVTINASIPQETRVAYNDATLKLSWETDDQILLAGYNGTTYKGSSTFTWQTGNTFTGTPVPNATTYKAYYLVEGLTLDETSGNVQLPNNFWEQEQNGNSTTGHLKHKLLLFDETAKPINQTFNLTLKSSIIRLNLTGIPQEVGTLRKLIYTVETVQGVFKSVSIAVTEVTFSPTVNNITAYLAFDPTEMTNIAAGGKVTIRLKGDKLYQWSQSVALGKEYAAGNRYTGAVSSDWEDITTPLYYVAKYNVNPTGNGFVTDLTACDVSGYFDWDEAMAISVPGYHLPSIEEWQGIVPLYVDYVYYVLFNSASPVNGVTENVVVQGQSITMISDFRRPGNNVSYALRYKGTDMVSAWKYELFHYDTDTCHMKITSRIVTSSETIDNIASNPTYWTTGNENDIVSYFPASGYNTNSNLGKGGYFRSSTLGSSSLTCCMGFSSKGAISNPSYSKANRYTVRLFTPGN